CARSGYSLFDFW
nr:immunoglobulin heavy chain junction region [Macaca mulatta]MOY26471.1 immunoglobulin heavy chain junction region [Macaca mulatta]